MPVLLLLVLVGVLLALLPMDPKIRQVVVVIVVVFGVLWLFAMLTGPAGSFPGWCRWPR